MRIVSACVYSIEHTKLNEWSVSSTHKNNANFLFVGFWTVPPTPVPNSRRFRSSSSNILFRAAVSQSLSFAFVIIMIDRTV